MRSWLRQGHSQQLGGGAIWVHPARRAGLPVVSGFAPGETLATRGI